MAPAEAKLVGADVRIHLERLVARPAFLDQRQGVVGAQGEERQLVAVQELVIEAGLVVPVDGRDAGDAVLGIVGEEERKEEIDVAAARRHRDLGPLAERDLHESDRLQQVDRHAAMESLRIALSRRDVDRARQVAPVVGAVPSRVEVDPVEELLVDDRGSAQEMVEDGEALPVEIDAGVGRRRPAHQERAAQERRAVQPRQILDDAKRIVERAGYVDQLLVTQRVPRRRILGPRAFHHR